MTTFARGHIKYLASSESKPRVLDELHAGPATRADLEERCSLSRATVHRVLKGGSNGTQCGIIDRGWVECNADQKYELTRIGRSVFAEYEACVTRIEYIHEHREFLNRFREGGVTIPPGVLDAAAVTTSAPQNPHNALQNLLEEFQSIQNETIRVIGPVASPVMTVAIEQMLEASKHMEVIIDEGVLEVQQSEYSESHERGVRDNGLTVFVHPESISFGLALFGDRLAMVGEFDKTGNIVAELHGSDPVVTDWAETVYCEYRARSRQFRKSEDG